MQGTYDDLTDRTFGLMTAIKQVGKSPCGAALWLCRCECGTEKTVRGKDLKSTGKSRIVSCGCHRRSRLTTHGKRFTPEYTVWRHMVNRCTDPSNRAFHNYGGRGIKVCDRWLKFENFIEDMGVRPSSRHTLERENNHGDYDPDNCVWATRKQQMRNIRKNRMITAFGKTQCVSAWAEELNLVPQTIISRLNRGEQGELALRRPNA